EAANRLDDVDPELSAEPRDEHLDRVGVTVEVLSVDVLDELAAGDDLTLAVHQIAEHPVLVGGEIDGGAIHRHLTRAGIERHSFTRQLGGGMSVSATNQSSEPGQELFRLERFREIV